MVVKPNAVMAALHRAADRCDSEEARAIFAGSVSDDVIRGLLRGVLVLTGDSGTGFTIRHKNAVEESK